MSEHDVGKNWVNFLNPVKSKLKFGGFEWAKPTNPTAKITRLSFISTVDKSKVSKHYIFFINAFR